MARRGTVSFIMDYRIRFALAPLIPFLRGRAKRPIRLLVAPELPHKRSTLYKICLQLGIRIVQSNSQEHHLAIYWQDTTVMTGRNKLENALNGRCVDISKNRVNQVFERTFAYPISVNPEDPDIFYVEKSDENAQHDGILCSAPSIKKQNKVYQKLINNQISVEMVRDIRVPIVGGIIPYVYFKDKYLQDRFTNNVARVSMAETGSVFSDSEQVHIRAFSQEMGLDFGELDVLRDQDDGRIYIVDVNKTPWGPPKGSTKQDSKRAMELLCGAFHAAFLTNLNVTT